MTPDLAELPRLDLAFGEIALKFSKEVPGDDSRGLVRYFHFRILRVDGTDVGHINFRLGDTEHVRTCAGHIGYQVDEPFRGNGYALQACRALAPMVRAIYPEVIITCDVENQASRKTIEKLGAQFIDEISVPENDPHYQNRPQLKRRYTWKVL